MIDNLSDPHAAVTPPAVAEAPAAGDPAPATRSATIKVIGVGKAGADVVELMMQDRFGEMAFAVVDTDPQAINASGAAERLLLESPRLGGLGSGGDPERARKSAEENLARLGELCHGVGVVILVVGLGGGAGTGIAPILAQVARSSGALVLAFVLTPFELEGGRRQRMAQIGLGEMKSAADGVICLPNQRFYRLAEGNVSLQETFKTVDRFLCAGIRGFWRLLTHQGLINIHFEELCTVIRDRHGESAIASVDARGAGRAREVSEKLLAHPMLDGGHILTDAAAVVVSIVGGTDMVIGEIDRVMDQITRQAEHAQILMGAGVDPEFQERLMVTVIVARKDPVPAKFQPRAAGAGSLPADVFSPPASRPGAGPGAGPARGRKGLGKMRQGQLNLDLVSKGRFDRSEPNIHKGEDLDIPTYIRRGVPLN